MTTKEMRESFRVGLEKSVPGFMKPTLVDTDILSRFFRGHLAVAEECGHEVRVQRISMRGNQAHPGC